MEGGQGFECYAISAHKKERASFSRALSFFVGTAMFFMLRIAIRHSNGS